MNVGVVVGVVAVGAVGVAGLLLAAWRGVEADGGAGAAASGTVNGGKAVGGKAGAGPSGGAVGSPARGAFGRWCLLGGLTAAGVIVGLMGTMIQGYTVRIGGSGPRLLDAGDAVSGGAGSSGFAFPAGAVVGLVLLTALLVVAGRVLRQPSAVLAAAGGWLAMVALLMFGVGDAGNVILANTSPAQIFVYGGMVVAFGIGVLAYQWQLTDRLSARAAVSRPADRVR